MEKKNPPKKNPAAVQAKGRKDAAVGEEAASTVKASGGLWIVSLGPVDLMVRDHRGELHRLAPQQSAAFVPAAVEGGTAATAPVPGMTMAAPSSVLWLEIRASEKEGCTLVVDPTEFQRHGARWGRPELLVYGGGLEGKAQAWQVISARREQTLAPGQALLVVGVGHGYHFQVQEIFSTLFAPLRGQGDAGE